MTAMSVKREHGKPLGDTSKGSDHHDLAKETRGSERCCNLEGVVDEGVVKPVGGRGFGAFWERSVKWLRAIW